jgi:3-deoxy-D-manno-octulosonic-acid transferase/heptosyltransferase-1
MRNGKPKILIVKLSAIGDVVHTLPALNALRAFYPRAHIAWLVEAAAAGMVVGHPALDRVLISERKAWEQTIRHGQPAAGLRQALRFIRSLRDTRYDMILDYQAALKGAALIALARGRRKIGFGPGMEHQECSYWFLNERVPMVDMETHALDRGLMLLRSIGVPAGRVEYRIPVDGAPARRARLLAGGAGRSGSGVPVAINPVALWETKLWLPERFSALADRLIEEHGAHIFFTGGRGDRPLIERIIAGMRHTAVNLAGATTLIELAALYDRMALVVSTDTGPMHIAAAMGTPVIALFGPTAEWRTGPYGAIHQVVSAQLDCRPCFRRHCDHCTCMRSISVDHVMEKVPSALAAKTRKGAHGS